MVKLSHEQERQHAEACRLVDLDRPLDEDEREFVLDHWLESSTSRSASDRAHFTPPGLARDMAIEIEGDRIIDLAAGIGRLAWHNRDLWGRWPGSEPEFVCVERNPDYVRVGRRVMPEAHWICADLLTLPAMADELGVFDCAISNPPFGLVMPRRDRPTTSRYTGRRFEYHVVEVAAALARRAVMIMPQRSAPFRISGCPVFEGDCGDEEYRRFVAATGIELSHNCGIDTTFYEDQWRGVSPRVEIVLADFTEPAEAGPTQLTLLD